VNLTNSFSARAPLCDLSGNMRTNNGVTSTFKVDTKNQLTNAPGAPGGGLTYDSNGNLLTANSRHNVYFTDDENRLTTWYHYQTSPENPSSGDKLTDFVYDGLSRLRVRVEYTWLDYGEAPSQIQPDGSGTTGEWVLDSE